MEASGKMKAPWKWSRCARRALAAALSLTLLFLSGCGGAPSARPAEGSGGRLRVVATIFPAWDWVRQILGDAADDVELTLLLDNGVDLHSYQPSADDMVRISSCDLFLYVGGESDEWVDDALKEAVNRDMIAVSLLALLGDAAKEEEIVEGMQADEEDGGTEYDEHVWLSLRSAALFCGEIAEQLGRLDPDNRAAYAANAADYIAALDALDAAYAAMADAAPVRTLVFGDRFPFRYLTDDYGLAYYAAFSGCSAETEASFETIVFLANKIDELGLDAVLTIESGDGKLARTVVENTAAKSARLLCLDSLQSTAARDIEAGASYLNAMESNLDILRQALT